MKIELFTPQDLPFVNDLKPATWLDTYPHFDYYVKSSYCTPLKITDKGDMIAVGGLIEFGKTAWIGHVMVREDYRNQGVGRSMMQAIMDHSKAETILLIATQLGYYLYPKMGFIKELDYTTFERVVPALDYTELPDHITKAEIRHYNAINALDKLVSGEDRSLLINAKLNEFLVYERNGEVLGFYAPTIREGYVYAVEPEAGLALMQVKYANAPKACVPETNTTAIRAFEGLGYKDITHIATRMYIGKPIRWQPESIYSRLGGNMG